MFLQIVFARALWLLMFLGLAGWSTAEQRATRTASYNARRINHSNSDFDRSRVICPPVSISLSPMCQPLETNVLQNMHRLLQLTIQETIQEQVANIGDQLEFLYLVVADTILAVDEVHCQATLSIGPTVVNFVAPYNNTPDLPQVQEWIHRALAENFKRQSRSTEWAFSIMSLDTPPDETESCPSVFALDESIQQRNECTILLDKPTESLQKAS